MCVEGQRSVNQKEVLWGSALSLFVCQKSQVCISRSAGDPSAFPTVQSFLVLLLEEIPGCSFSLGVFILTSQTGDKSWLLKWCSSSVSGLQKTEVTEECRSF